MTTEDAIRRLREILNSGAPMEMVCGEMLTLLDVIEADISFYRKLTD